MAERLIAPVLKTGERASVPGVRIPLYPPLFQQGTLSQPWGKGEKPSVCRPLRLDLMTADLVKTAGTFSLGPLFSKAGDFVVLVHSFIFVYCQCIRPLTGFELDVLNPARQRTQHQKIGLLSPARYECSA